MRFENLYLTRIYLLSISILFQLYLAQHTSQLYTFTPTAGAAECFIEGMSAMVIKDVVHNSNSIYFL